MSPSYRLLIESQEFPPRTETYGQERVVIGHNQGDLLLPDRLVSNGHAELLFNGQQLWLRDLARAQSTWLNGQPISETELHPQMSFFVGSHRVTYLGLVQSAGTAAPPLVTHQPWQSNWHAPHQLHTAERTASSSTSSRGLLLAIAALFALGFLGLAFVGWHWRGRFISGFGDSATIGAATPVAAPVANSVAASLPATPVVGPSNSSQRPVDPAPTTTAPDVSRLFEGPPSGQLLTRMVPLNRTLPKKLLVWAPPGWNTFDKERYDDLLQVVAPAKAAVVLINTNVHKVTDATRKLWTQSLDVRSASYGGWTPGTVGEASFPARISQGNGMLDGQPVELHAIALTRGNEEYLLIVAVKRSASDELRARAIAVAKSVRTG